MSTQASAREAILARIREQLPPPALPVETAHKNLQRSYSRRGSSSPEQVFHLLVDRLVDYDSEIIEVQNEGELAGAVTQAMAHRSEDHLLAAPGFPSAWLPSSATVMLDDSLPTSDIEKAEAVVTTCEAAVASTGTIILVHEGAQGRRAITLLPDHHICLVRRDQIFEAIPEAFAAIAPNAAKPITTISGPSATSDIEMTRIRGVHGPRRLTVVFYGELKAQ